MGFQRRNFLFSIVSLPASTLLAGRALPGLTATVYNGYELHTALQAAGHGSMITLAPGSYGDIGLVLASSDISVRVQSPWEVLRSPLLVSGDFADLDGLAFEKGVHLAGTGLVIANSSFVGNGIQITGVNTEVQHCDFGHYQGKAVDVRATAIGAYIHDNTFHDGQSSNAIMVGASTADTNKRVGARIINNTFQNCASASIKYKLQVIRKYMQRQSSHKLQQHFEPSW